MNSLGHLFWYELEELTHRDPGNRKLPSARHLGNFLDAGQLEQAAHSLAGARSVAIVTGFCTLSADPPAAETDGPPGALYLARALLALGIRVQLVSDCFGVPVLRAGCRSWNLPEAMIVEAPWRPGESGAHHECSRWCFDFAVNNDWTHLISIERPGPCSTLRPRADDPPWSHSPALEVKPGEAGHCKNMRGEVIDSVTAPLHTMFQISPLSPMAIATIGVADGGNEIGVGKLRWQQVHEALGGTADEIIICPIPTDFLLLAGVSNWAAYALAGAVCILREQRQLLADWPVEDHGRLIEALVSEGGAVDGISGARTATVDGLSLDQYLPVLDSIQEFILRAT